MNNNPRSIAFALYFRKPGVAGLMAGSVLVAGSLPAVAQQAELAEITVTAQYRAENIQDTPLAITALSAADLTARGFNNSYDVGNTVPNVSLRPIQQGFNSGMSAFIRGIGQSSGAPENEPGVAIYIDDVLQPVMTGTAVDLLDLERVELLRGPQGTLFGRGALGGAIRYITKKPLGDDTGSVEVTTGSFDRIDVRASYDMKITDTLFARVAGVSRNQSGYQTVYDFACLYPGTGLPQQTYNKNASCETGTQGGDSVRGVRGALRWVPQDDLEFTATGDYTDDVSGPPANTLIAVITNPPGTAGAGQLATPFNFWDAQQQSRYGLSLTDPRFIPNSPYTSYANYTDPQYGIRMIPQNTLKQWDISGKMDWNYSKALRTELIVSTRDFHSAFGVDTDASPLNQEMQNGYEHFKAFTGELRFSGLLFDRIDWTAGYFHYNGRFSNGQVVSMPAYTSSAYLVNGLNITESRNNSGYLHTVTHITDKLGLTVGIRHSDDTKDETFNNGLVKVSTGSNNKRFDWKAGLDYKLTDEILLYANVATGYRPQSFSTIAFQPSQIRAAPAEKDKATDFGIKTDFFNRTLRVNLAGFYTKYDRDFSISGLECAELPGTNTYNLAPAGTPVGAIDPVSGLPAVRDLLGNVCFHAVPAIGLTTSIPATIKGAELELQWRPIGPLNISGSFGYTDFKGDEVNNPTLLRNAAITAVYASRPTFVPQATWSLSAEYVLDLWNGSTLTPRADVYGQSEICYSIPTNITNPTITEDDRCQKGYALLNLRTQWESPNHTWTVAAGGTNVANRHYYLSKWDLASGANQPTITGNPGAPAEWYLTFGRKF